MKHSKTAIAALCLGIWLGAVSHGLAQYEGAKPVAEQFRAGFESIHEEQSRAWLAQLTSDKFAGRGTGQPGYMMAAHWVAGRLAEFGWEPIGDNGSYFQHVPLARIRPDVENSFVTGPNDLKIAGAEELGFNTYSNEPQVTGEVVLIRAHQATQEMVEELAIDDKVVLLVATDPGRVLMRAIRRKRPVAVLRVQESVPQSSSQIVRAGSAGRRRSNRTNAMISTAAARRLAEALGLSEDKLQAPTEPGLKTETLDKQLTVQARLVNEQVLVPNVVAWWPGSDESLRHEHVIMGAHLDHLGNRRGTVYPGADDNGSGTTAILQVAQAISKSSEPPRRSVLFLAFAAEEMGLIGSRHYCENPLRPLKDAICMVNMDMVGRNEENENETAEENENTIHLVGSKKLGRGFHETVEQANEAVNFTFEYDEARVLTRSDQAAFLAKGIPVTFFFGGFGPRYHRPTDTLEEINYRKIVSVARLAYLTLLTAADHGPYEKIEDEAGGE